MGKVIHIEDRLPPEKVALGIATPEQEQRLFEILARTNRIERHRFPRKSRWRRIVAIIIFWGFLTFYYIHGVTTGNWFSF